ncbi:unnamed protein product [Medioppia subpectinata]|uniref:Uncharacterized protein n=1 Tax=Medioppia subpectinata TaxID=1979941 RepID=A0A7R9PUZ1_9ACAR|nr:unnamed protein product [Medioppia subpectinata]CAG2101310.1 unnamed protein product [Medioppia subpectinata]
MVKVGDYGKYQKLMLWFVLFPSQLPYLCQIYSHLFMSITPDHWCKVSLLDAYNVTDHFNRHLFVPKKDNVLHSLQYEQCFNDYKKAKWDLVCDRAFIQTIPIIVFFSGTLELTSQQKGAQVLLLCELWRNIGALLLVLISLFPESPKWLIMNERIEDIDKLVRDIATTNVTLLSPDFSIALRRRIRVECALQTELKAQQKHSLLIQSLSLPKMPLKVITICLLYITHSITDIGFTYYIIEFSESRGNGDIYFPFLVVIISNFMALVIARITLKRFGRKYTMTFGDILSALFSLMCAFVKHKDINLCIIYFASAKVFQSSSQYCLFIWSQELLPIPYYYSIIGLCETVSQLALISVPLIIFYSICSTL